MDNGTEQPLMTARDVAGFCSQVQELGIDVWVDGGWCIDALLGRQLRPHRDLDIVVRSEDVPRLAEMLGRQGYRQVREDSVWNFVLADDRGHEIDVHAFVCDESGNVVDGVMYPAESLTGTGTIDGHPVKCISPRYMVEFLTPWADKWPEKYPEAIRALCRYSIEPDRQQSDGQ